LIAQNKVELNVHQHILANPPMGELIRIAMDTAINGVPLDWLATCLNN
jgi:hypothetical protein